MLLISGKSSSKPALLSDWTSGNFSKTAGVVRFTLLSVHCAESITATNNWKGLSYSNSVSALGACSRKKSRC